MLAFVVISTTVARRTLSGEKKLLHVHPFGHLVLCGFSHVTFPTTVTYSECKGSVNVRQHVKATVRRCGASTLMVFWRHFHHIEDSVFFCYTCQPVCYRNIFHASPIKNKTIKTRLNLKNCLCATYHIFASTKTHNLRRPFTLIISFLRVIDSHI